MDCPSEENLIRMALSGLPGVGALNFDLAGRRLEITHEGEAAPITESPRVPWRLNTLRGLSHEQVEQVLA
jgi:hypothetical protein